MMRNWVEYGCGKDEIGVCDDGLVLSRVEGGVREHNEWEYGDREHSVWEHGEWEHRRIDHVN